MLFAMVYLCTVALVGRVPLITAVATEITVQKDVHGGFCVLSADEILLFSNQHVDLYRIAEHAKINLESLPLARQLALTQSMIQPRDVTERWCLWAANGRTAPPRQMQCYIPDGRDIFYAIEYQPDDAMVWVLHKRPSDIDKFLEHFPTYRTSERYELWSSHFDGQGLHEVGWVPMPANNTEEAISSGLIRCVQSRPGTSEFFFKYGGKIWITSLR